MSFLSTVSGLNIKLPIHRGDERTVIFKRQPGPKKWPTNNIKIHFFAFCVSLKIVIKLFSCNCRHECHSENTEDNVI